MTGLEITLFILGTAFIIISFFIVGNNESSAKNSVKSALEADSFEQMRSDVMNKTVKEADLILHETEDKLESMSNDKIIAVGEYSDQILEKIGANHKEVVFLYQMLNEKEEELKATALKMENIRVDCEKLLKEVQEVEKATPKVVEKKVTAESAAGASSIAVPKSVRQAATQAKPTVAAKKPASGAASVVKKKPAPVSETLDTGNLNRNDEIISLHKSGKSVMEISKLLGMGQGEVKLIISLYC